MLRTPWGGGWRRFRNPRHVMSARRPADVRQALEEVEHAVERGSYAAGFVTYEAGAAFGLPVRPAGDAIPLVCFGIFAPEEVDVVGRLPPAGDATLGEWQSSIDHSGYRNAIEEIKARIEAGDTYQINFTFRLTAPFAGDPLAVMRDLYAAQAGPWSAYVDARDYVFCSASPELFYRVDGSRVVCRPMKGTWPRGYWPDQDLAHGEALRYSAKNRAENVMIVDLVRNDLGRVATIGSVRPAALFDVERYPLQWQMTSTVEASSNRPGLVPLFDAMFPCGSITGAPKYSSMRIIRDLESTPRGIYTGAIGYVSPRGRAHFNVAIRTVSIDRKAGLAGFGVGSGVVWDSVDRDEYDECLLKAAVLQTVTHLRRLPRRANAAYIVGDPPGFRLLESIAWTPSEGFVLLDPHLDRLHASADCFGFPCDLKEVRMLLAGVVEDLRGPAKVRVLLEGTGSVLCEAVDLNPLPHPVRLALASEPIDPADVFLYHKTTNRSLYERARASQPGADAVILWNDSGDITEATESNIVVQRGDRKITPPIACGLLPGILRANLLESGEIAEGRLSKDDLLASDRIWLINSVRGWMAAEF
ncbi:MAG: chorismate-binding protein [Acidobacteria bacterium]|nr:chorismate-binding protein [Acidobacteriota bacterium]